MLVVGIILAILGFGILIFIHELGHFIAAKKSNIKVNEFAIGMGPTLFKWKRGETTYALRLLPIGGFVAMEGEDDESEDSRSFGKAPLWKRMIVIVSGAFMNLLLGFILIVIYTSAQPLLPTTIIAYFSDEAVSSEWLQPKDRIVGINGKSVNSYSDFSYYLTRLPDGKMDIDVVRGNERVSIPDVQFNTQEVQEGVFMVDLDFQVYGTDKTFTGVVKESFNTTGMVIRQVWGGLIDLVTGQVSINQMSGPVGITQEVSTTISEASDTEEGVNWIGLLFLMAMISVNLGIFNLLPFPALDGGRFVFLLIEAIIRRPVNPKIEMAVNTVGIVLLMGLMLWVTGKDIINLF